MTGPEVEERDDVGSENVSDDDDAGVKRTVTADASINKKALEESKKDLIGGGDGKDDEDEQQPPSRRMHFTYNEVDKALPHYNELVR